jgi:hypothetical protein
MDVNHMHVVDTGWGSMAMQPEMGLAVVHVICIFHPKCETLAQAVAELCNDMNYLLKDGYCVVQCLIVILITIGKCAVLMPHQFQLNAQATTTSMMS